MINRSLFLLFILNLFSFTAFALHPNGEIQLVCMLPGCGNTLSIYEFDGSTFKEVMKTSAESDSIFSFQLEGSDPRFFYLGTNPQSAVPIILGPEQRVELRADCGRKLKVDFSKSAINSGYLLLKKRMNDLREKHVNLVNQYRRSRSNPDQLDQIVESMEVLDEQKVAFLDSLKLDNPYFAKIVALNTYTSFQADGQGYENEVAYFAERFFQYADLEDEDYNYMPWIYESFRGYVNTLSSVGLNNEKHKTSIEKQVEKVPLGTRARKLALSAVVTILREKNHTNFIHFAKKFIEEYEATDPMATADLQKLVDKISAFSIGGQAPDFEQKSPDGKDIKLSDFRGKVLLVDFWASWCGPCRRENPRLVATYNKYKEEGFEILGVSLDRDRNRWIGAIEKDGLLWPQVSDLKYWQNEVAVLYNVKSIPHTILLNEDGKIIARNLRGTSLEEKLAEIFGSE